jgi:hypothetical protein
MKPIVQLLAYRFGPDAAFEGRLVGALERMESGGTLRVLDVVFVGRDGQTGELLAAAVRSRHEARWSRRCLASASISRGVDG